MVDSDGENAEGRIVDFRGRGANGAGYFGLNAGGEQKLVDFRLRDGSRTAFSYDNLRFLDYHFEDEVITIEFGPFVATIEGLGLNVIYEGLLERRIRWVRETLSDENDDLIDGVRIDVITLVPPEVRAFIAE